MKFGVKQGEAPAYDPEGGSGGSYIKYFKDNETRLRFLEEVTDWTEVWMHFSQSKSRDYPCTGDRGSCPGCNHENEKEAKASKRYIVNAVATKSGYVDLWKIPVSIIDDIIRQSNNDGGTIKARDYTILKYQKDGGTKYSIDKEDRAPMDLEQYSSVMKDHQEALADAFRDVWGGLPNEDDYIGGELYEAPRPRVTVATSAPPAGSWSSTGSGYQEDPPSKPAAHQEPEQQEITEAQLRAMSAEGIFEVYKMAGIPVPAFSDKDDLVNKLIAALS